MVETRISRNFYLLRKLKVKLSNFVGLCPTKFPDIDHHVDNNWCYKKTENPKILAWLESECYVPHHHIKAASE